MNTGQDLNIRILPARQGLAWLSQSLMLIRAQPGRLLFLAVLVQLILGLTRFPLLGVFVIMAMPALSAGLLQAFHQVSFGQRPPIATLFAPLLAGPKTGRLLVLGGLMFVIGILAVSLMLSGSENLLDADLLARVEQGDVNAIAEFDPATVRQIIFAIGVGISISGTLSFLSIPLVWFRQQKLSSALISGVRALLLNWKPFAVLTLGLAVMLIPVTVSVAILFQLAGTVGGLSIVLMGLIMLIALTFQLAVFGTQFSAFRDIYGLEAGESQAGPPAPSDHQLLA